MSNKIIFSKLNTLRDSANNTFFSSISGLNGILSEDSTLSIKNSRVESELNKSISLFQQNQLNIISSNIEGTIYSNGNNNISNAAKYDVQHITTNQSYDSIYNFPSVNFEYNRKNADFDMNTTMFSGSPYISKPVLLSGDTPVFGSFNDSILLADTKIQITPSTVTQKEIVAKIEVTHVNGVSNNQSANYIITDLDTFFKNLPKNFNGHTLELTLSDIANNKPTYICSIKNIIGGQLIINFSGLNEISFNVFNSKNIKFKGNLTNNIKPRLGNLYFNNCKNIQIQNISINQSNSKPVFSIEQINTSDTALIYFNNTNAILRKCQLTGYTDTNSKYYNYGIIVCRSKVFIQHENPSNPNTFLNVIKSCALYNFSTVDSNKTLTNLQDYITYTTNSEDTDSVRNDGLYKHLHPEYIPAPDLVPIGATIGFPRIVNGATYCEKYSQASGTPTGILLTRAMTNILPSCYIPFDVPSTSLTAWRTEYQSKLEYLKGTVYESISSHIKPFNSATENNKYNLFFGNASNTTIFVNNTLSQLNKLNTTLSTEYNILSDLTLSLQTGVTYGVNAGDNDNGVVSFITNTSQANANKCKFSANLNLSDIYSFYLAKAPSNNTHRFYDFCTLIKQKSYIYMKIDNVEYTIKFKDLSNIDEITTILKNVLQPNVRITSLKNVPIQFKQSITDIKIYYFGIPADINCSDIIGSDSLTIKQFKWNNTTAINKRYIQRGTYPLGNLSLTLTLPYTPAYYQFYADTILCFYINTLDNSTGTNSDNIFGDLSHNIYTRRIFRRVKDAYQSSKMYLYISGAASADFSGLYTYKTSNFSAFETDTAKQWQLKNEDKDALTPFKKYKLKYENAKYKLYQINDNDTLTLTPLGTFNNINTSATISKNSYYLYSKAYGNLAALASIMPSAVLDVARQYQKYPSAYMQTSTMNGISYGIIPASGYNFDFSRKSINSMVSGYFRIKQKNKKFIYTNASQQIENRVLTGRIDGFQINLNNLNNGLNALKTYISYPLYTYTINNTNYNIYPFDTQSLSQTTPYMLNEHLLLSNALFSTINRVVDVMTQKHGKVKTDNITNTKKDILFEQMYPSSFCNNTVLSARYNKANTSYSESILDSYEMYWPIDNGTQLLSSYHTCIPFVKNTDIEIQGSEFKFKIGTSTVPCHPFGAVVSESADSWYPYLSNRTIIAKHYYNSLPWVYNLNKISSGSTITYTGIIKVPATAIITKLFINNSSCNINLVTNPSSTNLTSFTNLLSQTRNVVSIEYIDNNISQRSIFILPKAKSTNNIVFQVKLSDNLMFAPKYNYIYAYQDTISSINFNNFKIAYENVIRYACYKINQIWNRILSNCKNQASFISYSTIYNTDTFIYGMQAKTASTKEVDFNDLATIPDYTSGVFSIGSTVKYFNTTKINFASNAATADNWFSKNYMLSAIIPQIFNK